MGRALVRDGVRGQCAKGGGSPGAQRLLVLHSKIAVKASMTVHLVRLNKCHRFEPPRFSCPRSTMLFLYKGPHYGSTQSFARNTLCGPA